MNIRNLFNKKKKVKNTELVLPSNLASIPMRDKISLDKIDELNKYKEEYRELLISNKHLFGHDITRNYFNDEMVLNFNLFGKLVINHDEIFNRSTTPEYIQNEIYVHRIVTPIKIKLYIDKMHELYTETHLRLIALTELYNETKNKEKKLIISNNNKRVLVNEIYNLTTNYVIFANNVYAALREVETYKNEIKTEIDYDEKTRDSILNEYFERIVSYVKELIPNKLNEVLNMPIDMENRIAYMERELELYAYNNLNVDEINNELVEIDKIPKTLDNKELLLEKINLLEKKYIVLNDYGRYELELRPLYEIKFDILTIDLINQETNPFDSVNDERAGDYYDKIIAGRVITYITGDDSILEHRLKDEDKRVIQGIKDILPLLAFQIKESTFLLNLVLSMRTLEDAKNFLKNYKVDITHYDHDTDTFDVDFHTHLMSVIGIFYFPSDKEYLKKFPFGTLCQLYSLYVDKYPRYLYSYYTYAAMYEAFVKNNKSNKLYVPEGIARIDLNCSYDLVFKNIAKKINNKIVKMPSTLRNIDTGRIEEYLDDIKVSEIVLNEGLREVVTSIDFNELGVEKLTIPSTLEKVYNKLDFSNRYNFFKVPQLKFINCEKSVLLRRDRLDRMLLIMQSKCEMSVRELIDICFNYKNLQYVKVNGKWIVRKKINLSPNVVDLITSTGYSRNISINSMISKAFYKDLFWLDNPSVENMMKSSTMMKIIKQIDDILEDVMENPKYVSSEEKIKTKRKY